MRSSRPRRCAARPRANVTWPRTAPGTGRTAPATRRAPPSDALKAAGVGCPPDANPCTADQCDGVHTTCQHPTSSCSLVTNSSLCTFDVDDGLSGSQLRLILTPDQNSPSAWKLNGSNPGQY